MSLRHRTESDHAKSVMLSLLFKCDKKLELNSSMKLKNVVESEGSLVVKLKLISKCKVFPIF